MRKTFLLFLFLSIELIPLLGNCQNDPDSQFEFGYQLLEEGKYDLAMEVFKPLASHNNDYDYRAEAAFYFSVAAKKAGYLYQARQMMIHSVTQFQDWKDIDQNPICFYLKSILSREII